MAAYLYSVDAGEDLISTYFCLTLLTPVRRIHLPSEPKVFLPASQEREKG